MAGQMHIIIKRREITLLLSSAFLQSVNMRVMEHRDPGSWSNRSPSTWLHHSCQPGVRWEIWCTVDFSYVSFLLHWSETKFSVYISHNRFRSKCTTALL